MKPESRRRFCERSRRKSPRRSGTNSKSEARRFFNHGLPGLLGYGLFRICRRSSSFILLLALLIASWQFAAAAQTAIISLGVATNGPIDGIDCITSENQEKQPAPYGGNSPNFPDSTTDLDDDDGGLDDWSADTSTRTGQDTPLFSVTGLDAVTLRTPRIVPILLFPVHCFYCLHEHIRERAPPCRAEALA
jgi:hypothetical protein